MIVIKELIYFMFALFLLMVLMCLVILCGWLLNTLCTELLDIDVISLMKLKSARKKIMPYKKEKNDESKNI